MSPQAVAPEPFHLGRITDSSPIGDDDLEINLEPDAVLRGRVVYEDNDKPAVGFRLGVQTKSAHWVDTETDARGRFELRGFKPEALNLLPLLARSEPGQSPEWTAAAVEIDSLESGEVKEDIKIVLTKGGVIRGEVKDAKGHPLTGVDIAFYSAARPRSGAACQSVLTAKDGSWAHRFPPGDVYVYIRNNIPQRRWSRQNYTLQIEKGQVIGGIDFILDGEAPADSPYRQGS